MIWGDPIEVGGVRPDWLRDDDRIWMHWREGNYWSDLNDESWTASDWIDGDWRQIDLFRPPAAHPAYLAIAKGFEPWSGGDSAPEDWTMDSEVLFYDGIISTGGPWTWLQDSPHPRNIIGYKKRQPEAASDDVVRVKRMTEDEARVHWMRADAMDGPDLPHAKGFIDACRHFGLIREPTQAENIAQKTGLTVDQVQSVLNEVSNGTR